MTDSASASSVTMTPNVTPRFTADGTKILFVASRPKQLAGSGGVFLSNLDGTGVQSLFECSICASGNDGFNLSPDGRLITFAHYQDGRHPGAITIIDLKGRVVWSFPTDIQEMVNPSVSFSPDGQRILFASCHGITGRTQIKLANLQTRSIEILQAFGRDCNDAIIDSLSLSPDGKEFLFSALIPLPDGSSGQFHVFKASVPGTNRKMLTPEPGFSPAFLPNGQQIVFVTARTDASGVYIRSGLSVMDASGENRRAIVRTGGAAMATVEFAVAPDGKRIVFSDGAWGQSELFLVNVDGTNQIRLRDLLK